MNHLGITPRLREENRNKVRKRFNAAALVFSIVCLLPVLVYGMYSLGIFRSVKGSEFQDLEMATALVFVEASGKTGSAFLVSGTKLLTARHVVDGLNINDQVILRFEKANPPMETTATLEWMASTTFSKNELDYFLSDVAVLRLDNPALMEERNIFPIPLGNSDGLGNLTPVIAIGYPNGDYSIKRGDINSVTYNDKELFKVDPATNGGDSGGPLILAEDGTAVGMMVGGLRGAQGENVANKINNILALLDEAGLNLE